MKNVMELSQTSPFDFRDRNSFAYYTLVNRIPAILRDVLATEQTGDQARITLLEWARDPAGGIVEVLELPPVDRALWEGFFERYEGRRFIDLPFFEFEAYFYMALLAKLDHFNTKIDPFARQKTADFLASALILESVTAIELASKPAWDANGLQRLVTGSLVGNTIDLSNSQMKGSRGRPTNLIVSPSPHELWMKITAADRITFLVDNAFSELWYDLLLIRGLLGSNPELSVEVVVKAYPMFVSDVTLGDWAVLGDLVSKREDLSALSQVMRELEAHCASGRMKWVAWNSLNAPLHFSSPTFDLTPRACGLLIVKGDANYRRIFGDKAMSPTTPLSIAKLASGSRLLLLRVLKSDCVCGLQDGDITTLSSEQPDWRTNGYNALIQYDET